MQCIFEGQQIIIGRIQPASDTAAEADGEEQDGV